MADVIENVRVLRLPDNPSVDNPAVENPSVDNLSVVGQSVSGQSVSEQISNSPHTQNTAAKNFHFFMWEVIRDIEKLEINEEIGRFSWIKSNSVSNVVKLRECRWL